MFYIKINLFKKKNKTVISLYFGIIT